jgi:hypothetical protein
MIILVVAVETVVSHTMIEGGMAVAAEVVMVVR